MSASADSLSASTRAFYEQTRWKMAASIFLASMGMMMLAYVSTYGGQSNSANFMRKTFDHLSDDSHEQAQVALAGGYGFGAFMFFVAFSVFLWAAIYISPIFCGSANEKKMLTKSEEIDQGSGYGSYTTNPVQTQAGGAGVAVPIGNASGSTSAKNNEV